MKVIVKTYAGSHLFGTNTPDSDTDYKGIFIPSADDILLGTYPETVQKTTGEMDSKNGKEDVDIELYSLRKFFKMLRNGDTAAIELLFTPEELIVEKDPIWDEILAYKDQLLSKKVTGIIGYARHQANKYGTKGVRLGELSKAIENLKLIEKEFNFNNPKMKHAWDDIVKVFQGYEHVKFITLPPNVEGLADIPAIDILGKKFDYHCGFSYVLESLKKTYKDYGRRAREAKNNGGVDWKALSHALRVSIQGVELLQNGKITLPLSEEHVKMVRGVKLGEYTSNETSELIELYLGSLELAKENSDLQEELSKDFTDQLLIMYHKRMLT